MNKWNNTNLIQFISLIILILVGIGSIHYILSKMPEKIAEKVTAKMLAIEYDKVGWMENYVKLNKIQKEQIIAWLKQYEAQKWQIQVPSQDDNSQEVSYNTENSWNTISLEKAKKVTWENTYILWNRDAEISFVEYSDLECPFCKRLHESGTIEEVLKAYDWKVNFIFKQFPLSFHAKAPMEAEAALCAWKLGWSEKYYEFINKTFSNSRTNWNSYTKESIAKLAESIGLNKKDLLSCIESWKFKDLAQSQTREWSSLFWITGTPWNVLINNKTGKWEKLPWAYPVSAFKEKINSLLIK
jgi:protein-disulfide isomerase